MVSSPSASGITSSSSQSSPGARLPASKSVNGSVPNTRPTAARTTGMRVAPPTITTPRTSAAFSDASRSARRAQSSVRSTRGCASASNSARVSTTSTSRPSASVSFRLADSASDSASRAARAAINSPRRSAGENSPAASLATAWSAIKASKSSPPSAVSPPVEITSNTP
ncbi:hypothetical protein G6F31_018902 [Rhizopus arrhizus]|nr:hypothetical protein G6F31_018902 [Rhizopus arrhizus]